MTQKEFKKLNIDVFSKDKFIYWIKELPEGVKLATDLTPFREYNKIHDRYENKIGEIYFEKSVKNIYHLVTIKDYTSMEQLLNYILKGLIYV